MTVTTSDSELDRGPAGAGSERFCALTRSAKPAADLIRFVVGPDGDVVPDVKRKLPGRGIWISLSRGAIDEAVKRRVFGRGFKRDVRVDAELGATTERLLERSALDALAMAGKGGQVVQGFAKVEIAINRGDAVALIEAADGAEDGKRKVAAVLRRKLEENPREMPVIANFSSSQLDLALDRINVVHAALLSGPATSTFLARTERFLRFRTGVSAEAATDHGAEGGAGNTQEELRTE